MKDPGWLCGRNRNQLEQGGVNCWSDDQESILSFVLVLDQS